MAKANNTPIEDIIGRLTRLNSHKMDAGLMTAIEIAKEYIREERRLIQDVFDNGQANWEKGKRDYEDGKHYFFMNYVDND